MRESGLIAHTLAKNFLHKYFEDKPFANYFDYHDVHVHVPEGAVTKDGPSAGITLMTALFSLVLNEPTSQDIAMSGEISLNGKVLPIGGVKEKILAAKREGLKKVILPIENKKEYLKIQEELRRDIEVLYRMLSVFKFFIVGIKTIWMGARPF